MYKIKIGDYTVSIEASNPSERSQIIYSENTPVDFRQWLKFETGPFGHELGDRTSFVDLHFALSQSDYKLEIIEGEILSEIPPIPDDAVS
jgi:hypothetical protein